MAEVSNLEDHHHHHLQHHQRNPISQTLDSIESSSLDTEEQFFPPDISSFVPYSSHPHFSDSDSDSDFAHSDSDSYAFYGDDDHLNYVTDLFASREERVLDSGSDPFLDYLNSEANFRVFGGGYDDCDSNYTEELGLGSGGTGTGSSTDGLRVVRLESDSDSEDPDVNYGVCDDESDPIRDCLGFEDYRDTNEELEWEEVDGRVIDEREGIGLVINRMEELSVSSELSIDEESVRNLEWEVLLAVNNWARPTDFEPENDGVSYLGDDVDIYDAEYETIFGQFMQNESALKGAPPTSKSVIESLPLIVLTKEELEEENVVCAVCKDEILVEEKVTRLPCRHYYHGDCIVPWLGIRNTCPVCRYELPTDDLDYEQRKTQMGDLGLPENLEVRFNFELVP